MPRPWLATGCSKEQTMSKETVEKSNVEVTVPDIKNVEIVDTGESFHVHVGGAAYGELMRTEVEFPEMAGNRQALAVFALAALASMLTKQLVEGLEKSGLDGATPSP